MIVLTALVVYTSPVTLGSLTQCLLAFKRSGKFVVARAMFLHQSPFSGSLLATGCR